MSRLRHSKNGFIRSLQISRYNLFAFVEGKVCDPYFYGKLCDITCSSSNYQYEVRIAKELPNNSGGKQALVNFYKYVRTKKKLLSDFHGKKTALVFFMDKDIDDILRTKCRSPHVIYTQYYDLQNQIFKHSNFVEGVAAALSIDPNLLKSKSLFINDWCKVVAFRWREWIALCILAQKYKVRNSANYRLTSQVNHSLNGSLDTLKYNQKLEEIRLSLSWNHTKIAKEIGKLLKYVDKCFLNENHDRIFKGKWYNTLIEIDLKDTFRGHPLNFQGVAKRVSPTLVTTLDFSKPWSEHFTIPLKTIVNML
jgi:hypothetical protein